MNACNIQCHTVKYRDREGGASRSLNTSNLRRRSLMLSLDSIRAAHCLQSKRHPRVHEGEKYGLLTVIGHFFMIPDKLFRKAHVVCECQCGKICVVACVLLRSGNTKSCGCWKLNGPKQFNATHGFSRVNKTHPLYYKWLSMKARCYNPNVERYGKYGARGIRVCDEWLNDPVKFIRWAIGNGWKPGLEIDRKDNDGAYSPENCRFVTHADQARNKSNNVNITWNGETHCLAEWARRYGIDNRILSQRRKRGIVPPELFAI